MFPTTLYPNFCPGWGLNLEPLTWQSSMQVLRPLHTPFIDKVIINYPQYDKSSLSDRPVTWRERFEPHARQLPCRNLEQVLAHNCSVPSMFCYTVVCTFELSNTSNTRACFNENSSLHISSGKFPNDLSWGKISTLSSQNSKHPFFFFRHIHLNHLNSFLQMVVALFAVLATAQLAFHHCTF